MLELNHEDAEEAVLKLIQMFEEKVKNNAGLSNDEVKKVYNLLMHDLFSDMKKVPYHGTEN